MNKFVKPKIILVPITKGISQWSVSLLLAALLFGEARNQCEAAKNSSFMDCSKSSQPSKV